MFGTIRKHQNWLWILIITVVSISMVVFFSSDGSFGGPGQQEGGDFGSMNGQPFTRAESYDAMKEIQLAHIIRTGRPPGSDEATRSALERDGISRLFLIYKLKEMDIHPSEKAIGAMMEEQIRDYPLAKFEQDFLQPNGLTFADYRRFLANEVGIRQLFSAAAVSARLVSPQEAEALYRKQNQEVATEIVGFWATNFLDKVVVTNGAVATYFSNRMALYRVPERAVISYVVFEPSNYLAEAEVEAKKITNMTEIVTRAYFEKGTNEWKDAGGKALTEAEAKKKILDDIHLRLALTSARRAASEFGTKLMNEPEPNKVTNFDRLAGAAKLTVRATQPFDGTAGLEEFKHEDAELERGEEPFTDVLRKRALSLPPDRPVLFNPIPGRHGIYMIAFKQRVPSSLPVLSQIESKVTADYKHDMALQMARTAGRAFHTSVTNGLAAKKPFDEICAAAKVTPVNLPLYSPSTRSLTNIDQRVEFRLLQSLTADMSVGEATGFMSQPEGGYVAYVKARPPIDETKMKTELPEFIANMRQYRQSEAFNKWFQRQAELAKLSAPKREATVGAPN